MSLLSHNVLSRAAVRDNVPLWCGCTYYPGAAHMIDMSMSFNQSDVDNFAAITSFPQEWPTFFTSSHHLYGEGRFL